MDASYSLIIASELVGIEDKGEISLISGFFFCALIGGGKPVVIAGTGNAGNPAKLFDVLDIVDLSGAVALETIGDSAFSGCEGLRTVNLSGASKLETIGDRAFYNCRNLDNVYLTDTAALISIGNSAFYNCPLDTIDLSGASKLETIGNYAFEGSYLKTIEIPKSVTSIGNSAFSDCASLSSIVFESGSQLGSIGNSMFRNCSSLKNITIPASVTSIGAYAFSDCTDLETITCSPTTAPSLGTNAFEGCDALTAIYVPEGATGYTTANNWSDKIVYPDTTAPVLTDGKANRASDTAATVTFTSSEAGTYYYTVVESGAAAPTFDDTTWTSAACAAGGNNINITLTAGAKDIYIVVQDASENTSNALKITISAYVPGGEIAGSNLKWSLDTASGTLTISGEGEMPGFAPMSDRPWNGDSSSIQTVVIEDGVTSIGNFAFWNCTSLTTVDLSNAETLETIGDSAFWNCTNLKTVTFPAGSQLTDIGDAAFASSGLTEITLPASVTTIGNSAFASTKLTSITIPAGVTTIGNAVFASTKLTSIAIPEGVKTIGNGAFEDCTSLGTVDLSRATQLETIGNYAFASTKLTSIIIPASVTAIEEFAFSSCDSLETVTFPADSQLKSIGNGAFSDCSNLAAVDLSQAEVLETIGVYAFQGSALTEITILAEVTSIEASAFWNCDSLTAVTFNSMEVPALGKVAFDDTNSQLTIYIPPNATGYTEGNWAELNVQTGYLLTVDFNGGNGSFTGDRRYAENEVISIDAGERAGYRFTRWTSSDGGSFADASRASTEFTMPAADTTITANWRRRSSGGGSSLSYYHVTFDTNGGEDMRQLLRLEYTEIDLEDYIPEREGYTFAGWYLDSDFDREVDSIIVEEDITFYAKWEAIAEAPEETEEPQETEPVSFTDVEENDWFYDAVNYAVKNGLMSGMSETIFTPNTPLTREMLAVVLYNVEGQPESTEVNPFTDIKADLWYTDAILWANANGIVAGYDTGAYGVGDAITREQFVTILYRYAQWRGYDVSIGADTNLLSYTDAFDISEYAYPAMQWACGANILNGMGDGTFRPKVLPPEPKQRSYL